jgi:hypothetical protein
VVTWFFGSPTVPCLYRWEQPHRGTLQQNLSSVTGFGYDLQQIHLI